MKGWGLIGALVVGLAPVSASGMTVSLVCDGIVTRNQMQTGAAWGRNSDGVTTTAQAYTTRRVEGQDRLRIEITDTDAKLQLPRSMIPPANGGGDEGWWHLNELKVTDTEISGRFAFNIMNRPKVKLDRVSGDIQVDALGRTGFRGTCDVEDRSVANRKF